MALIGLSKFETFQYISVSDGSRVYYPEGHEMENQLNEEASIENGATVFLLGALSVEERAYIIDRTGVVQEFDEQTGQTRLIHRAGTRNVEACRFGIRGWSNFPDKDGNDIPFKTINRSLNGVDRAVPSPESMGALTVALITEIGTVILERNALTETTRKN